MANNYTTIASVKALMPDNTWSTKYDALLTTLVARASRLTDSVLRREPGAFAVSADTTRYFDGSGNASLLIGELAGPPTVVAVAENGVVDNNAGTGGDYTTITNNDYFCEPYNRVMQGRPFLKLEINPNSTSVFAWPKYKKAVKVTGPFGFATAANLPDEIVQAVEIQVVRWWKRGQQAFQDVGAVTDLGQLRYVKAMDPDIVAILKVERFAWL